MNVHDPSNPSRRSNPGEGRLVEIHAVGGLGTEHVYFGGCGKLVEDYSVSRTSYVVKINPLAPKREVVKYLRLLADRLESQIPKEDR